MEELLILIGKGLAGGAVSWLAKKALDGASSKLEELRGKPLKNNEQEMTEIPGEYSDEELEELLDYFLESSKGADEITIIRSRIETSVTYWRIKIKKSAVQNSTKKI